MLRPGPKTAILHMHMHIY